MGIQARGNILVKRSKWSYHRTEGEENLDHIENVALDNFSNGKSLKKSINCPKHFSSLYRMPEIYEALK